MKPLARVLIGFAALAAGGCGGTADLAGTVTYQGKPVVFGTVVVIGADGTPKSGAIQPDGTYRVTGLKGGPAKVAVSSPPPAGAGPAKGGPAKGGRDEGDDDKVPPAAAPPADPAVVRAWVRIPDQYGDPDKSGLTAQVGAGGDHNIDLK